MAIVMEGFSIREYTSRMRSTDVEKCWPFREASAEVVEAILPPMTVEKFSWWFDKLQLAHQDENDDNDDDDDESLQSLRKKVCAERGKAKAKAPKKRSIVELFAAAPQVERVSYSSEDGDGSEDGGDELPILKKKGAKEKVVMIKDLKRDKATKKQIVQKAKASNKLKLQSSADVGTHSSRHRKDLFDGFAFHLKKSRMKRSAPHKSKVKPSSVYKFFSDDQQEGLAVHGLLENQSRMVASANYSDPLLPDATKLRNCDTVFANKHISFSAMDGVLKPSWKTCPTGIASEHGANSDGILASSANDQASNVMDGTEEERTRFSKDKFVVQNVTEKPLSSRHRVSDGSVFLSGQHDFNQANLFGKLAMPRGEGSQHSRSHSRVTLPEELYSCSYEFPSVPEEAYNRNVMNPVFNRSRDSCSSNPRLLDLSGCAGPRPPTPYHSSSPFFPRQNMGKNHCEQALSSQWIPHLAPQELMHSIRSLPDWNSRAPSRHKESSINKDFVGLPLNSLGGLMSMNSNGRNGFNHIRNAVEGPPYSSGMQRSSPNMIKHCVSDLYGVGKSNSDKDAFDPCLNSIESVVERLKVFHIDCDQELPGNGLIRQPDQHISLQVTRSTMRLMGKNFTIEDREGSTGKHTITGYRGGSGTAAASSVSCHEKSPRFVVHPILGKLRETVADIPKPKANQAFESNPRSKVSAQFLGSHNNVRRNLNDVTKGKGMQMPAFHPHGSLPSSPSPNRYQYSTLSSASNPRTESPWISISSSTPSGSSQNASRRINVPGAGKLFPSKYPFSDSKSERHIVHQPWSQNSVRSEAPYALSSREKRTLMSYCHPSSVPDNICYPCSISGANYGTEGSAISCPQSFHPSNFPVRPGLSMPLRRGPRTFHPSNFPVRPGLSMPARRGPRYFLDNQMQSRLSVRVPGHGGKSKKRLPSVPNVVSNKPPKIPKISAQDDCSITVVDLEASSSSEGNVQVIEPPSAGELLGQSAVHEPDSTPQSGPVKLTGGSRYVLRPSPRNDIGNSESGSSTSRAVASNVGCEKSS